MPIWNKIACIKKKQKSRNSPHRRLSAHVIGMGTSADANGSRSVAEEKAQEKAKGKSRKKELSGDH